MIRNICMINHTMDLQHGQLSRSPASHLHPVLQPALTEHAAGKSHCISHGHPVK